MKWERLSKISQYTTMIKNNFKYKFFTNNNGFSKGIYKSLNCGLFSNDNSSVVLKNLNYTLTKLGLQNKSLILPNQNHTKKCLIIKKPSDNFGYADGLVTKLNNIVLGITTADCLPILFFDKKNNIIGICHAGWRGITKGIIQETVKKMIILGSNPANIISIIGPCIRVNSYEVQKYFLKNLKFPRIDDFITINKNRFYLNLPKLSKKILKDLKIKIIKDTRKNTYLDINYFSYRESVQKNHIDYGRNLSLIAIK